MSNHSIVIKKIVLIKKHPNADRLEIVKLDNLAYDIIVQKDTYSTGDLVLLFQDSLVLPFWMVNHFGLSYLKNGNIVKPAKIRGVVSQAMVLPLYGFINIPQPPNIELEPYLTLESFYFEFIENKDNDDYDYSTVLGVTRQEEIIDGVGGSTKGGLPSGVEKYDLESVERYVDVFESLLEQEVEITEKLEGTNFTVHVTKDKVEFCSRNLIKEGGLYQDLPEREGIVGFAKGMFNIKEVKESVTIRGEIIGTSVQGNIYKKNSQNCYVFDIKIDGEYIEPYLSRNYCDIFSVKFVPIIFIGTLKDYADSVDVIKEKSNGKSLLNKEVLREGIVIKTLHLPRVTLKQRSPDYLSL